MSRRVRSAGLFLVVGVFLAASGCAHLDVDTRYQPPTAFEQPASLVVDAPFDRVWDDLVRRLSQSFFHVDQVSKDSRLITLSVKDDQVDGFVTCGQLEYTVNGQPWVFDPAQDSRLFESSYMKGMDITHETSGRVGRMNIFVGPEGAGTVIEVNAVFELAMREHGESVQNNLMGQRDTAAAWQETSARFRLTTTQPDTQPLGTRQITCQSTRVWESGILELAR